MPELTEFWCDGGGRTGVLLRGWFYCLKKPDAPQKT